MKQMQVESLGNALKATGQVGQAYSAMGVDPEALSGSLGQAQAAQGLLSQIQNDSASQADKDKFTGTNTLKKLGFTAVKGLQAYIVFEIMSGAGGIYTVDGTFYWYIPYIIYASFVAQFLDLVIFVAPSLGAKMLEKMHATSYMHSIGTINVMCSTALISCLVAGLGPSGPIAEFLQDLIQYQVMIVNLDSGLLNVFDPMPAWMTALLAWIESIPRIIWNKIVLAVGNIYNKVLCKSSWWDFAVAVFSLIFDWSSPPTW